MSETTEQAMPPVKYIANLFGWTVRLLNGETLLGFVGMPDVQAATWHAWLPAESGLRGEKVAAGVPGRGQAAEALWERYTAGKAVR